jgi:HlyD family secretion protein
MVEQQPAFELYGLDMAQIAAVTPQGTMTLDITIDELDIKALQVGMTAQVRIDALGGEKYTATITQIGNTGVSNGGNSKYTVELTMDRAEDMLSGMNATATIVLSTASDVLTIPADALVENGNQTVVYTGYDEENDLLLNPVTVKVGCSDGETVEVLEGLALGQTYYYAYYDTLEISFTPDFGGGFMFG